MVAWCLRFINNLKLKKELRKMDDLSLLEMSVGKSVLISIDQKQNFPQEYKTLAHGLILPKSSSLYKLTPFMDESGLLRIKGRLQCSDLTLSSLLIRFQHKLKKHSGFQAILVTLRNQYWIIGGRKLAKRVKRFCIQCQKQDAKACDGPFAPLPSLRVQKSPPFYV